MHANFKSDVPRQPAMEVALYTFCVMYSPGPVNILAFNEALNGGGWRISGYCFGVGLAMLTGFLLLSFIGRAFWIDALTQVFAVVGSAYILYLAYKLWYSCPSLDSGERSDDLLRFGDGYWLQLLNPKGLVVILPVTTVMFPAAHLSTPGIVVAVLLISIGAVGAPGVYALGGALLGYRFAEPRLFFFLNRAMAVMLVFVALSLIYDFFIAGDHPGVLS